jgi:hypothetical protein
MRTCEGQKLRCWRLFLWREVTMALIAKKIRKKRGILLLLSIMPPVLSRALDPEAMTDQEPNFDVFLLNSSDNVEASTKNPYIKKLTDDSLLCILQPNRVNSAFEKEETIESSLFHLFLGPHGKNRIFTLGVS